MVRRTWTAEELEQMTPAQQDEIFDASIVTDLDEAPQQFLSGVRTRLEQRLAQRDTPPPR